MLKSRATATTLAVFLAAAATFAVFLYLRSAPSASASRGGDTVTVVVSKRDIPAGTRLDSLIRSGAFTTLRVPSDAVVQGAVTDLSQLRGRTTSSFILADEQISTARLEGSTQPTGGVLGIPGGYQAVTVSLDPQRVVSSVVQSGDHVSVYATVTTQDRGEATATVVPDAQVLNATTPSQGAATAAAGSATTLVTLALRPFDAEKVILAQEQGHLWLGLLPPSQRGVAQPPVSTSQLAR